MEVNNHRLSGPGVSFSPAGTLSKTVINVDTIVIHYTAGPSGDATVRLFASPTYKLSAHLVSHEDGRITQMVDFNKMAAHAGESKYAGRVGYNKYSIGIEISNPGYLVKNPKAPGYVTWWEAKKATPKSVDPEMVFEGTHRNAKITPMKFWHKYPQAQIDAVFAACEAICKAYNIKYILGHEEIAPGRKSDPGPAFPLDELREKLLGVKKETVVATAPPPEKPEERQQRFGTVNTKLNFRAAADPNAAKLSDPIPAGTKVEIIGARGDWYNIIYDLKGWIKKEHFAADDTDEPGDGEVVIDNMPMFTQPKADAPQIYNDLQIGDNLYIVQMTEGWMEVYARIPGWVMKKFVTT